jgi:hypothetical protein
MEHHFDIDLAKKLNVNCAIIYKNLEFWCSKNKANNKNFIDGNYWTYNSVKAWKELFPYLGETQIKNALKTLEENGYIMSGEHNANKYDRTKWYCILELEVLTNGDVENSQPIPYNKPDKKTYIDYDFFINEWNSFCEKYNKSKVLKITDKRRNKIQARHKDFQDFKRVFELGIIKAKESDFLLNGSFFSFDWLIENDTNLVKVLEDKYKGKKQKESLI